MTCIVSTINEKYAQAFCVMLTSLVTNNPNLDCDYVVMYDGSLSDATISAINNIYKKIIFYKIKNTLAKYDNLLIYRTHQWLDKNYSVFSRFEMFDLENYNKIIYLDVDIIIDKSIDYLLNECNDSECYAVKHEISNYFNAGIMVINKKDSFQTYKNRCINIIKSKKEIKGNQEIFNKCFEKTVTYIDCVYNLTTRHSDVTECLNNKKTVIFHYPGEKKPWDTIKFVGWYDVNDQYIKNEFINKWSYYEKIYMNEYQNAVKLTDIHVHFETDKGTAHGYIPYYESTFSKIRLQKLNVLEIGVLFGGSLKMWSKYFPHACIFGIDDFSQKNGHKHYNYKPVDVDIIKAGLSEYKNITLYDFSCESLTEVESNLKDKMFDIIIDDASHTLDQQLLNLTNFSKYLNKSGIYICEDIQSKETGELLLNHAKSIFPDKNCAIFEFNCKTRKDDRLLSII